MKKNLINFMFFLEFRHYLTKFKLNKKVSEISYLRKIPQTLLFSLKIISKQYTKAPV